MERKPSALCVHNKVDISGYRLSRLYILLAKKLLENVLGVLPSGRYKQHIWGKAPVDQNIDYDILKIIYI